MAGRDELVTDELVNDNLVTVTNSVTVTTWWTREISAAQPHDIKRNHTLTITNAQTTNSGFYYQVIVTNYGGSVTSSTAFLQVTNVPPEITLQPISQTNGVGTTVTLAVTATGTVPLSYQWQVDGTNLVNGAVKNGPTISGATSNVLTISNVQLTNSGNYTVIVTNITGLPIR